jgi:hypothetical protein
VRGRYYVLAGLLTFGLGAGLSRTTGVSAGHSWGCYKWASPNITYSNQAQSPYSTYYTQEARTDSNSWHNYTVVNFNSGSGGVAMQSGLYGQTGWLGLATIQIQNQCTITSAVAKVNRTYLDNGYTADQKKRVACHEVGHTTGLNHNPSSSSCLKTGGSAVSRPNSHDAYVLDQKY